MKTLYPLFHANFLNKSKLLLISIIALNLTACWQVTVVKPPVETNQQDDAKVEDDEKSTTIFNKHIEKINNSPKDKKNVVGKLFSKKQEKNLQNTQTELLPINSNLGSISYDVSSWSSLQVEPVSIAKITANPALISQVGLILVIILKLVGTLLILMIVMRLNKPVSIMQKKLINFLAN